MSKVDFMWRKRRVRQEFSKISATLKGHGTFGITKMPLFLN
jgi:hypothetical protein